MISVIQRVSFAKVTIDDKQYTSIDLGLLVFSGILQGDDYKSIQTHARKIIDLRIFQDKNGKMNNSIKDIGGEILVISQFTLCTDKNKSGNRPSFTNAEKPELAKKKFELFLKEIRDYYNEESVKSGIFAANMKVQLLNNGPVTIILEK